MIDYVLGLDMGSNSVGWAAISLEGEMFDNDLAVYSGVRIFPEGIAKLNTAKEKSRAQDRREARSQRRQHRRKSQRRKKLLKILQQYDMAPKEKDRLGDWLDTSPYSFRSKGVEEKLAFEEFGRALFHLCQRRGYKSNRKQGKSKDDGKVAKETTELQARMDEAECKTLGQYLAGRVDAEGDKHIHRTTESHRVRDQYTLRSMYENEFDILWKTQSKYYPSLFTDALREEIHDSIFYQRPLFWDRGTIGQCELEEGEERCAKAHWVAQKFRILQEVNNLLVFSNGQERPLDDGERKTVVDELMSKKTRTFDQLREKLGFLETQTFNLEVGGKRKELKGNCVEVALNKKILKKWYGKTDATLREDIYAALADIEDEDELRQRAINDWGLSEEQVTELLKISLPTGRMNISLKAMLTVMPFLEQGMIFSKAKEMAGYDLRKNIEQTPVLPPVDEAIEYLTNPLVHRALSEARKLVNAIIRKYGPPKEIVIELARDMKNSSEKRKEIFFENVNRRDENEEIRKKLKTEFGLDSPKRDDIIKYRLWKECNKTCVYTGKIIPQTKLFTGEVQVEHILPYSRTLDDSYMLCCVVIYVV